MRLRREVRSQVECVVSGGLSLRRGRWIAACGLVLVLAGGAAGQDAALRVLALAPGEQRAVMQWGAEPAAAVEVPEEFGGGRYVLRRVVGDHVVVLERVREGKPRELWVYLADARGRSAVRVVERTLQEPAVAEPIQVTATPQ